MLMSEMTKPAMANPLGLLNNPMKEKMNPSNQKTMLTIGAQQKSKSRRAKIKPAVPIPLLSCER